ncbi:MAG: DUF3788 family protein [Calditrichaeota bacterium]|nr:MAG: DUF3788 family protein [Calditrichota bacterium]MBL1207515.1 DUF3788 family protein [Calditrichota bacterium]NOG47347.1 DUF3788 family protein [Calditrichota bacterium]
MNEQILSDQSQYPTEEIIFSHIGESKSFWESLFNKIHDGHPDFNEEWRYYNDGKSWLFKLTKKKKTIFWLSIQKNAFLVTFYFGDKVEPFLMQSAIPTELIEEFKNAKRYGKIRPFTLTVLSDKDVEIVLALIEIKLKL